MKRTNITVTEEHWEYLQQNHITLSKWLRTKLQEEIDNKNENL